MRFVYLIVPLFLFIQTTVYGSQKHADEIASLVSVPLGYLDNDTINKQVNNYLYKHPEIKALKITETLTKKVFVLTYREKDILIKASNFPNSINTYQQHIAQSYFNDDIVGKVEVYTEKDIISPLQLSQIEKRYLKMKQVLNVCIDPQWLPFEAYKNKKHVGISSDFVKIFSENIGIPIELLPTKSWTESLTQAREHNCDFLPLVARSEGRDEFLNFTTPYISLPIVIATKPGVPFSDRITQLQDKTVGIVKDYSLIPRFKKKYPNLIIKEVSSIADGLKQVHEGEIFGFIDNSSTINQAIQKDYIGTLIISGKFEEQWELAVGVRKDEPILLSIFQKAIDSIPQSKHREIFDKWSYITITNIKDYTYLNEFIAIFLFFVAISLFWMNRLSKANAKLKKRDAELEDLNQSLEKRIAVALKDNRKKERLLVQKNRLADMGDMIRNIAHQWRQPLATANMAITLLKKKNIQDNLTKEYLAQKLDNIESLNLHMSQTIEDFLSFFNPKKEIEEFNVLENIKKTLALLQTQINKQNINVHLNIEDTLVMKSFLDEFIQVLISIITNSFQAYKEDQEKNLYINAKENNGKIYLEIIDNAGGIPKNIMHKIFDPYFTTKHQSSGTGLGLYISKLIIENKMHGTLNVQNINNGAKFTIIINT